MHTSELPHFLKLAVTIGHEIAVQHHSARYVIDESGKVVAVQIDPSVYQALLVAALGLERIGAADEAVLPAVTEQRTVAPDP